MIVIDVRLERLIPYARGEGEDCDSSARPLRGAFNSSACCKRRGTHMCAGHSARPLLRVL